VNDVCDWDEICEFIRCLAILPALIDMYSCENTPYDSNFRQCNHFRSRLLIQERREKCVGREMLGGHPLRGHGEEITDNLGAFIKYGANLKIKYRNNSTLVRKILNP